MITTMVFNNVNNNNDVVTNLTNDTNNTSSAGPLQGPHKDRVL